jgi:hypothetical protein
MAAIPKIRMSAAAKIDFDMKLPFEIVVLGTL